MTVNIEYDLKEILTKLDNRLKKIETKIDKVEEKLQTVKENVSDLKTEIKGLDGKVDAITTGISKSRCCYWFNSRFIRWTR